jgi:hypothetical protein
MHLKRKGRKGIQGLNSFTFANLRVLGGEMPFPG